MSWSLDEIRSFVTKHPCIRVAHFGEGNWRTIVRDEPDAGAWDITGPPYPSKAVAMGQVDEVRSYYFGELPARALLAGRIEQALAIAAEGGSYRKVERMAQALRGHQVDEPAVELAEDDLEVSTVRPGAPLRGQGGQTTGETDAYVRVTHKPTGITVERDAERSQLMNKHAALTELARLLKTERAEPGLPRYPLITVSALGDMFDPAELRRRVIAQLLIGDVVDPEIEAYQDEAAGDDYEAVLGWSRRWVRVYS